MTIQGRNEVCITSARICAVPVWTASIRGSNHFHSRVSLSPDFSKDVETGQAHETTGKGWRKMGLEKDQKEKVVLVVDDDESIRRYLKVLLSSEGHRVVLAAGGEEAIAEVRKNGSPSLMLLDTMMPEIDGLETLRRIREIDKTLPVVVLSAMGQTRTVVHAMKMGA